MSSNLTPKQNEIVSQFKSIVPMADGEIISILKNHDWNLDEAIQTALAISSQSQSQTFPHNNNNPINKQKHNNNPNFTQSQSNAPQSSLSSSPSPSSSSPPSLSNASSNPKDSNNSNTKPSSSESLSQSPVHSQPQSPNSNSQETSAQSNNNNAAPRGYISSARSLLGSAANYAYRGISTIIWGTNANNYNNNNNNNSGNSNGPRDPSRSRLLNSQGQSVGQGSTGPGSVGSSPDILFMKDLTNKYPGCPPMFLGSYTAAVNAAKQSGRPLLIYLHSPHHEDTEKFCSSCLSSESLHNFISENLVLWCGSVTNSDALRLSVTLHATSFPFIALVAPTQSVTSTGNVSTVALIFKHQGLIDSDSLIIKLLDRIETHAQQTSLNSNNNPSRATPSHSSTHRNPNPPVSSPSPHTSLIAEQNAEYEEALALDRLRAEAEKAAQQEALENERKEKERLRLEAEAEAKRLARIEEKKMIRLNAANQLGNEVNPGPDVVTVLVRGPNGKRYQRRFNNYDNMAKVFLYIKSLELVDNDIEMPHYRVFSNFPRVVHNDPDRIISDLGLGRQIALFVEEDDQAE